MPKKENSNIQQRKMLQEERQLLEKTVRCDGCRMPSDKQSLSA